MRAHRRREGRITPPASRFGIIQGEVCVRENDLRVDFIGRERNSGACAYGLPDTSDNELFLQRSQYALNGRSKCKGIPSQIE